MHRSTFLTQYRVRFGSNMSNYITPVQKLLHLYVVSNQKQALNKLNNFKLVIIMELTHYSPNHSRSKNPSVVIGKQK